MNIVPLRRVVDVVSRFGIDQRHAGLAIEMAGEIGELFGEHFEDRRVDLNCANPAGAEEQTGKDVTTAADANDSDVSHRLHEVGCIDDIIFQVSATSCGRECRVPQDAKRCCTDTPHMSPSAPSPSTRRRRLPPAGACRNRTCSGGSSQNRWHGSGRLASAP
jgi:hypothetical protein